MNKDIRHLRELMEQHNKLTQNAIDKAEQTMNHRLESLNEFRAQQADIIARFATMEKLNGDTTALHQRIDSQAKQIDELKQARSKDQGRGQIIQVIWALMASVIVVLISKHL